MFENIFKLGTTPKAHLNERFGMSMSTYAPFYVVIKTENDNEVIPCADLETAEYCMSHLKRYGFKYSDMHLYGELKQED